MPTITATMSKTSMPMAAGAYAPAADSASPGASGPRLASFGEVLWDVYPSDRHLGGAPANLAFHAQAAGAEAILISAVGQDELGDEALVRLSQSGVDTRFVRRLTEFPTGRVDVDMSSGSPRYTIASDAAWDHLELGAGDVAAWGPIDAFCFGSLAARSAISRASLELAWAVLAREPARPLYYFDPNLRAPHVDWAFVERALGRADVVKMNEDELAQLEQRFGWADGAGQLLAHGVECVAVTRAERGASLWTTEGRLDQAGLPSTGADAVGAGDAFGAELVVGLLRRLPLVELLERACRRAAWVASQPGAMPPGGP